MRPALMLFLISFLGIAGTASTADVSQDSIDACIDQLRSMPDQSGGTVLSTEFSEANSLVMLEDANGAQWRCLVSNDGVVAELNVSQPAPDPAEQAPALAQVIESSVSQDAIDACIDQLRTMPGQSSGTVLSTEFSEANSLVMLEDANGAQWRCLVSNDGQMASLEVSQPAPAQPDPAPAQGMDASVNQDSIDACIDRLRSMSDQSGGTILGTEFSEANSLVMLEDANGAQWRCLVSNDGVVAELNVSQPAPAQAEPAPAQAMDASVNQDSIDACIDRLRTMPGQSGGTILSTEFSEANSVVMMEDANGAQWRCLVSNNGVVAELNVSQPAPARAPAATRAPDYADGMSGGPDFWMIDTNTRLRVHNSPSLASPVAGRLPRGAVVPNLGCRSNEGRTWCQIPTGLNDGATVGWAASEFLTEAAGPARMPPRATAPAPAQNRPAPDYADGMSGGPDFWEVNVNSSLRVHGAPSTGSPTFARLPDGSVVRNLGCRFADGRRWCQVPTGIEDGASIGWVAGEFLTESSGPARIPEATRTSAPAPRSNSPAYVDSMGQGPRYWQVNVHSSLKVHSQPSTTSPVVERLHRGVVVRNLGCQYSQGRTWCHVPTGPYDSDPIGWVTADYLVAASGPSQRVDHHVAAAETRTLRMRFASGTYGGDHADTLAAGSSVRYIFGAANRQTLEITFYEADPSIEYQIIMPNGRVLLDPIPAELPYQGELFMGGDYVLEVFNRGAYDSHFTMYMGIY